MKKKIFSIISTLLAILMCFSLVGCGMMGGNGGGTGDGDGDEGGSGNGPTPPPQQGAVKTINFTITTESSVAYQEAIRALAKKWNDNEYIKDDETYGFKVQIGTTTGANAVQMIQGTSAPALIEIDDKYSRNAISNGLVTAFSDIGTIATGAYSGNVINRYKSGTRDDGKMSPYASNAKLYSLPIQTAPATLFYNEKIFNNAGINIVYLTEAEALAAGLGAYGYHCYTEAELSAYGTDGLTKTNYNELLVNANGKLDGSFAKKEGYRIFNARVAMSIEETFILSSVLTKAYNTGVGSTYGFNSEYWFPFGWTVGGDCVATDLNGNLVFSLSNTNANYIVTADTTVNGHSYKAGELLSYADKDFVAQQNIESDDLYAISSISEVFSYFVASSVKKDQQVLWADNSEKALAKDAFNVGDEGLKGFGIAFDPNSSTSYVSSFTAGESAMLYRSYDVSSDFQSGQLATTYNVAPTPQYKEYNADGSIKTVNGTEIKGYKSTMDANKGIYIPDKTQYKQEALTFLAWLLEDAQQMDLVATKFAITPTTDLLSSTAYLNAFKAGYRAGFNAEVVLEAATYATAPDWCYTSDNGQWVNNWSLPLNDSVRTGKRSLYSLFFIPSAGSEKTVTEITNDALAEVSEYEVVSHKTFQ